MRKTLFALSRTAALAIASLGVYAAMGALLIAVPVVLLLGLVAAVGLGGSLMSLMGWLVLGYTNALTSAATLAVIGAVAFVGMVLLFDAIASTWRRIKGRPSASQLRISLA